MDADETRAADRGDRAFPAAAGRVVHGVSIAANANGLYGGSLSPRGRKLGSELPRRLFRLARIHIAGAAGMLRGGRDAGRGSGALRRLGLALAPGRALPVRLP